MTFRGLIPLQRGTKHPVTKRPLSPFSTLQSEMNRLFEDFGMGVGLEPFAKFDERLSSFAPSIDIDEGDDEILITAELPGMDKEDVDITLAKDYLTIRGEKKEETERKNGKEGRYYERTFGAFERVIPIISEIDEDKVDASFDKGVLHIKLPKTHEAKRDSKKVSVRSI